MDKIGISIEINVEKYIKVNEVRIIVNLSSIKDEDIKEIGKFMVPQSIVFINYLDKV